MQKCKFCNYEAPDWKQLAEHIINSTDAAHDDKKWARNFINKQTSKPATTSAKTLTKTDIKDKLAAVRACVGLAIDLCNQSKISKDEILTWASKIYQFTLTEAGVENEK